MTQVFESKVEDFGPITLPSYAGVRVMMMPFLMEDAHGTIPNAFGQWREAVATMCARSSVRHGVGYITIDEALVRAGETHRRPGLHVDGYSRDGILCATMRKWAENGMILAASHIGCRGWNKELTGEPGVEGDCSHLSDQCTELDAIVMQPGRMYWCGPTAVHEALPMTMDTRRQFVRLSMPSDAPWYEGCTVNPLGIRATGLILQPRTGFMAYRPTTA